MHTTQDEKTPEAATSGVRMTRHSRNTIWASVRRQECCTCGCTAGDIDMGDYKIECHCGCHSDVEVTQWT